MNRLKLPTEKEENISRENPAPTDGLITKGIRFVGEAPEYTASFKTRGRLYTGTGASASEAIAAVALRNAKGMGVLTVSKGEKSKAKVLSAPQVYRLFSPSRLTREVALKNISALFQDV